MYTETSTNEIHMIIASWFLRKKKKTHESKNLPKKRHGNAYCMRFAAEQKERFF